MTNVRRVGQVWPSHSYGATASFATNIMTLVTVPTAGAITIGSIVSAAGVATGTTITGLLSGTINAVGSTYSLSTSPGTIGTESIMTFYVATTSLGGGQAYEARLGNMGQTIVANGAGWYHESAYRLTLFNGAHQAAQAITAGIPSTTYTGLCLSNPINSTINISLSKVAVALSVAPVAIAPLAIMTGYSANTNVIHTSPLTPQSCAIGSGMLAQAKLDYACTIPTPPQIAIPLQNGFTAGQFPNSGPALLDVDGSILLYPGGYAMIFALTTVTGLFGFNWDELPR